jgi:Ca2+ transporting ATPase
MKDQSKKESLLDKKFTNSDSVKYELDLVENKITPEYINEIFNLDNIKERKSANLLNKIGGTEGLLTALKVDFEEGLIINNSRDLEYRVRTYGKNDAIVKDPKTLNELILECLEDPMLRILLLAAFVSLIIGVAQQGWSHGWIEGFSIFLAVFIVVAISSVNNLQKEKQFHKLNQENEKKMVHVKRGRKKIEIPLADILVGDILFLEIGNVISVDSILLTGSIEVDESSLTGESEKVKKDIQNPFLISGGMVTDGECLAIVCAVGTNSSIGRSKLQMQDSNDKTPLQEKLTDLADKISNYGMILGGLIFFAIFGREFLLRVFYYQTSIFTSSMLDSLVNAFILAVTVIVVAIPEGLPMAVTISLAYSVIKMKEEGNLVRHLDASETMGNVNNVCTDKTGTLTEGNMFVRNFFFSSSNQFSKDNVEKISMSPTKSRGLKVFSKYNINPDETDSLTLLTKAILNNVTAFFDPRKTEVKGNSTECAILRFLIDNDVDIENNKYKETVNNNEVELVLRVPFKSDNKYMCSVYQDKENILRIYIKGAPEIILNICNRVIWENGKTVNLSEHIYEEFKNEQEKYAQNAERTLALAYFELTDRNIENIFNEKDLNKLIKEKVFTLIALFGISDPPRTDVVESIKTCHSASVFVRMVTGDNINTALAIAKEVGIVDDYEYNLSKDRISKEGFKEQIETMENIAIYALEGKDFHSLSGGYKVEFVDKKIKQEDDLALMVKPSSSSSSLSSKKKKYMLKNPEKFAKITKNLKIIARASPDDKFLLVLGLKELKNIVAVTGDGTNDAPALKKSDVGFAMGKKGTDIAKEASDIILLNDTFSSIITAIKYGRNVYDCIRKFVQFQLAVNIVAVFMTLLGGIILADAPLNAIQMLWVNLIMDSFASLALATEDPSEKLLKRKPYPRTEPIITSSMMKNILSQAIFQIILLTILIFWGDELFNVPSDRNLSHFEWNETHGYHFTIFFNIFVFLQVFNSINARKLHQNEVNVFEGIDSNKIYLSVQGFIIVMQVFIVQFGGRALRTQPLTFNQHFACILIASLSLLANYLSKTLPVFQVAVPDEDEIRSMSKNIKLPKLPVSRGMSFRSERGVTMPVKHHHHNK